MTGVGGGLLPEPVRWGQFASSPFSMLSVLAARGDSSLCGERRGEVELGATVDVVEVITSSPEHSVSFIRTIDKSLLAALLPGRELCLLPTCEPSLLTRYGIGSVPDHVVPLAASPASFLFHSLDGISGGDTVVARREVPGRGRGSDDDLPNFIATSKTLKASSIPCTSSDDSTRLRGETPGDEETDVEADGKLNSSEAFSRALHVTVPVASDGAGVGITKLLIERAPRSL